MAKTGRPIGLTDKIEKDIIKALSSGAYLADCAACAGVDPVTMRRWMTRGVRYNTAVSKGVSSNEFGANEKRLGTFARRIKSAVAKFDVSCLTIIKGAAEKGAWQAAAWLQERKYPQKWGRYERVELVDDREAGGVSGDDVRKLLRNPQIRAALDAHASGMEGESLVDDDASGAGGLH